MPGSGWKWVGRRSRWRSASLAARADGCGRRGCKGLWGEEAVGDERGRQMGAENCADGCGRRGCKGVAGNG